MRPEEDYDQEAVLITEIGRAMCSALDQGTAVVSIATGTHRRQLERQLTLRGIDVIAALNREQYVSLNARETLSKITFEGLPDVMRFADVIGDLVDRTAARYPRVLMFGELVALMCADGKHAGAIELEELWRSFTAARPVFLRREYPAHALHSRGSLGFTGQASGQAFPRAAAVARVEIKVGALVNPLDTNHASTSAAAA